MHYNESSGEAFVGSIMLPGVSDADNNDVFFMSKASVELFNGLDGELEELNVNDGLVPNSIIAEGK